MATEASLGADDSPHLAAERQRIARELHDSTSQLLVVLQLQVGELRRRGIPDGGALLDEMDQVLRDVHASIKQLGLTARRDDDDLNSAKAQVARFYYSLGEESGAVR